MFGHDKTDDQTDAQVMAPTEPIQTDSDDTTELTLPAPAADDAATPAVSLSDDMAVAPAVDEPADLDAVTAPETSEEPEESTVMIPAEETSAEDADAVETATASVGVNSSSMGGSTDLASLKKEALKELSPLVGHLDQPPEEKLKTIMMLYDATKDQSLLNEAHEAAIGLSDDTARAKALLDLVQTIDEASA